MADAKSLTPVQKKLYKKIQQVTLLTSGFPILSLDKLNIKDVHDKPVDIRQLSDAVALECIKDFDKQIDRWVLNNQGLVDDCIAITKQNTDTTTKSVEAATFLKERNERLSFWNIFWKSATMTLALLLGFSLLK